MFNVTFDGLSVTTPPLAAGSTDTQIASAIAAAVNAAGDPLVTATSALGVVTLDYFSTVDPDLAITGQATTNQNVNIASAVTQAFTAFQPGVDLIIVQDNDGSPQINPALGYDIFDVSEVLGTAAAPVYQPEYFWNDKQNNAAGAEYVQVNALIDSNKHGVLLIDTLDGVAGENSGWAGYQASDTTELARLQRMVTAADGAANSPAGTTDWSVIITVRDNTNPGDDDAAGDRNGLTGNWYQVQDGPAAGDAQVIYLGTTVLFGYDSTSVLKDPIGDYDQLTIVNFTYQTGTQLIDTYAGGLM